MEAAQQQTQEYREHIRIKDQENAFFQEKLRASESKVDAIARLLEEQKAELKGVHTFLTTSNLYSGADIIQMVDALNADIFQLAIFVAELIEDETMSASYEERTRKLKTCQRPLKPVFETIGTELCTHLANKFTPSPNRRSPTTAASNPRLFDELAHTKNACLSCRTTEVGL
ncbi:hypothetical protein CVT25_003496 [Psilocybe cyanescens]|uniref:Uncharacterized protein n=1 Tax=Psilocybe cyanescens TaxID=93625 RepID=A0A409X4W2_PSICY|nr:hypothetical protein CVT25_003496 [Psilocybe cyanescens]